MTQSIPLNPSDWTQIIFVVNLKGHGFEEPANISSKIFQMISSGKVKVAFVYFVHCKSNVNRFLRWNCQNICCRSNQHQKANLQRPCALILKEIVCVVSWGRVCFFFLFFVENSWAPYQKVLNIFLWRKTVLMSESMYFLSGPLGPGLMGSDPKGTEDR